MKTKYKTYRKLIAAGIGVGLMVLHRELGIDFTHNQAMLVDMVIAILTAAGVWGLRNDPAVTNNTEVKANG